MTTTTKRIPSINQQRVLDWIVNDTGSCVVISVAGSGKSTLIEMALPVIPAQQHVQCFAFNTTIAKELGERIARLSAECGDASRFANVRAGTFHKVGFGAILRKLGLRYNQVTTDSRKCNKMLEGWLTESEISMYGEFICKLVGLAKGEGIGAIVPDVDDRWYSLIQHHDLYLDDEEASEYKAVDLARQLLQRSNEAARRGSLDFNDQLYIPLLWKLRLWQNDWVIVDEAQDTNPVRRAMARLALKPGGRLIAVGDPKQAIYGFTGASHDAIDIIKREFRAVELPLTVSYRCAQAVVREAQEIVPYIEAHPGAPEGKVEALHMKDALQVLGAHDAILCRNTSPLIKLVYGLIARGTPAVILGREIGTDLANLVRKMKTNKIDALERKLAIYRDRETSKFLAKGEEQKAEAVSDRVECVLTVLDNLDENSRTVGALITRIESLFSDTNGVLTLCTGHKAKGKEWRRVGILRPDLMPSKWARQQHQLDQEYNLIYVMYTRAMEHLIFIQGEAEPAKPKKREE